MNIKKLKINWRAGEITTIIALGTMAFILVTTIASTFISKKPQTTATKAAGCTTGNQTSGSTSQTCSTICGSYSNYVPGSQWTVGSTRYCCCKSGSGGGAGPTTSLKKDGEPCSSSSQCYSGKCAKDPKDNTMSCVKTTSGTSSSGSNTSSTGCCTITSTCGSYGCPEGNRYVRRWPNVTNCTGNYIACPKFTPYANENEGCYKDNSCTSTGSGTNGCTAAGLTCPNSSNTYNVIKTGTKYTYYKSSDTSCSGTTYSTYEAACSASIKPTATKTPTPSPSKKILGLECEPFKCGNSTYYKVKNQQLFFKTDSDCKKGLNLITDSNILNTCTNSVSQSLSPTPTASAMGTCVETGRTLSIGVLNFTLSSDLKAACGNDVKVNIDRSTCPTCMIYRICDTSPDMNCLYQCYLDGIKTDCGRTADPHNESIVRINNSTINTIHLDALRVKKAITFGADIFKTISLNTDLNSNESITIDLASNGIGCESTSLTTTTLRSTLFYKTNGVTKSVSGSDGCSGGSAVMISIR